MKILYLITDLFGGGAEKQLSYLALGMTKCGHEVHIGYQYADARADVVRTYNRAGIRVHRLGGEHCADPRLLFHVLRLIRREKFDIIQTCIRKMDVIGGLISSIYEIPWILREANCTEAWAHKRFTGLRSKLAGSAACIVSNFNAGDRYWASIHPSKSRRVVYNGFPFDEIKGTLERSYSPYMEETSPYILYAGRLEQHKNIRILMNVFSHLEDHNVTLIVAGDGPLRQELETQVFHKNLKNVKIIGRQSSKELWQLMRGAVCLALLSDYEGFPNVTAEAALLECPLLLSDIQSHRDLWGQEAATLVNPHNTEDIVAGMKEMLLNPDRHLKLRMYASKKVSGFTLERMVQNYLEIYSDVIKAYRTRIHLQKRA